MTNEPHTSPIGIDENNQTVVDSLISTVWDPDRQAHVTTTLVENASNSTKISAIATTTVSIGFSPSAQIASCLQ